MLTYADAFKQILEVENTPEILNFAVPEIDILLWPYVRVQILMHCLAKILPAYGELAGSAAEPACESASNYKLFTKTARDCFKPWPERDIFMLNSVGSSYHKLYNGKLYNVYHEPFAEIFPENTLYLDASYGPEFIKSSQYALCRTAPISLVAGKISKYMPSSSYEKIINSFINFIKHRINLIINVELPNNFYAQVTNRLFYLCKFMTAERKILKFLLPKKAPKLCIIQNAHYGGYGNIINLLKERGAIMAEDGHGIIYSEHIAYNWAKSLIADKRLLKQSPDIYLSYGDYFNQFFKAPGLCYTIGNAWFSMMQGELAPCADTNAIVFLLSSKYDVFLPMIKGVKQACPKKNIIVRCHPSCKQSFMEHDISRIDGITIDANLNLYDTLASVSDVVGTLSTSSYESAAMGKRVFVIDTVYTKNLPAKYFTIVSSAEELLEKLQEPWTMPDDAKDVFFNRNWKENYKNFVAQYI